MFRDSYLASNASRGLDAILGGFRTCGIPLKLAGQHPRPFNDFCKIGYAPMSAEKKLFTDLRIWNNKNKFRQFWHGILINKIVLRLLPGNQRLFFLRSTTITAAPASTTAAIMISAVGSKDVCSEGGVVGVSESVGLDVGASDSWSLGLLVGAS